MNSVLYSKYHRLSLRDMEEISANTLQLGLTVSIVFSFILIKWVIRRSVWSFANRTSLDPRRISYVLKMITLSLTLVAIWFLAVVWEVSIEGLSLYFASIFTIVGVAFFASWSIISNVTAAMILFFYYPFKIGSKIKIMDGDNSVIGVIKDITLFTMIIESEDSQSVVIPNNVVMQKTSLILD